MSTESAGWHSPLRDSYPTSIGEVLRDLTVWNEASSITRKPFAEQDRNETPANSAEDSHDWRIVKVGGAVLAVVSTAAVVLAASRHLNFGELFRGTGTVIDSARPLGTIAPAARPALNLEKIDTLIFDFDRTLIDTDGATQAYQTAMLNALVDTTGMPRELLADGIAKAQAEKQTVWIARRLDQIPPLREKYGDNVNQTLAHVTETAYKAFHDAVQPTPDIIEMLDSARATGKRMVMNTAGAPAHTIEKLEATGLGKYFDHIFVSRPHPFEDRPDSNLHLESPEWSSKIIVMPPGGKHTPDGYTFILQKLGLIPERAVATGDHIKEDVAYAQDRGLYGILATYIKNEPDASVIPDLVIDHPVELTRRLVKVAKVSGP